MSGRHVWPVWCAGILAAALAPSKDDAGGFDTIGAILTFFAQHPKP